MNAPPTVQPVIVDHARSKMERRYIEPARAEFGHHVVLDTARVRDDPGLVAAASTEADMVLMMSHGWLDHQGEQWAGWGYDNPDFFRSAKQIVKLLDGKLACQYLVIDACNITPAAAATLAQLDAPDEEDGVEVWICTQGTYDNDDATYPLIQALLDNKLGGEEEVQRYARARHHARRLAAPSTDAG